MIELVVAETGEPEADEIRLRVAEPTERDLDRVLRPTEDVWYGTHYLLRGDSTNLVAISTSGPVLLAGEPGDFLLYDGGRLVKEHALREEVIQTFLRALDGR